VVVRSFPDDSRRRVRRSRGADSPSRRRRSPLHRLRGRGPERAAARPVRGPAVSAHRYRPVEAVRRADGTRRRRAAGRSHQVFQARAVRGKRQGGAHRASASRPAHPARPLGRAARLRTHARRRRVRCRLRNRRGQVHLARAPAWAGSARGARRSGSRSVRACDLRTAVRPDGGDRDARRRAAEARSWGRLQGPPAVRRRGGPTSQASTPTTRSETRGCARGR
jgi:hypothetical protein